AEFAADVREVRTDIAPFPVHFVAYRTLGDRFLGEQLFTVLRVAFMRQGVLLEAAAKWPQIGRFDLLGTNPQRSAEPNRRPAKRLAPALLCWYLGVPTERHQPV